MRHILVNNKQGNMDNIEQKAKEFWNYIFGDDFDFLDKYFETYFEKDNLIIGFDNESQEVKYMTLIIQYDYKYFDKIIRIAYLTAISTNPKYRNQGLMKENLNAVFKKLNDRGIYLACLIPANDLLKSTYERYDFVSCFTNNQFPDNNKAIIHHQKTFALYKELGYNISELTPHNKGMIKILDKSKAIDLYYKHNPKAEPISNTEDIILLTKQIFGDSYMNLMFDE